MQSGYMQDVKEYEWEYYDPTNKNHFRNSPVPNSETMGTGRTTQIEVAADGTITYPPWHIRNFRDNAFIDHLNTGTIIGSDHVLHNDPELTALEQWTRDGAIWVMDVEEGDGGIVSG
jgi:hypothetical protein